MTDVQTVLDMQNAIGGPASRYQVKRCLGSGGMGDVYLAEDTELHRLVAIKTVRDALRDDEEIRKRIARECLLHAKVGPHPHIVTLFDKLEEEGRLQLIMEYVDGETLQAHLARLAEEKTVLPLHESVHIIAQSLEALSRIHGTGIVHRDIKPANIILARDEHGTVTAKLMDFGIARAAEAGETTTPITRTGSGGPGTPLYMAPEQIDSRTYGAVSPATDIYAMGVLLYQLVSGAPPFDGTLTEVLNGHLNLPVPPLDLDSLGSDAEFLSEAIERALAKTPSDRFPSAKAFQDELASLSVLQGTSVDATQKMAFAAQTMAAQPRSDAIGKGATVLPNGAGPSASPKSLPMKLVVGVAVVVAVAALGVAGWSLAASRGGTPDAPVPSASPSPPVQAEAVAPESLEPLEPLEPAAVLASDEPAMPEASEIPQVLAVPDPALSDPEGITAVIPEPAGPGIPPGVTPGVPGSDGLPALDGTLGAPEDGAAMAAFLDEAPAQPKQPDDPAPAVDPSAPVAAAKTAPSAVGADARTYVVQSGDSIAKISDKFDVKTSDLARWNQLDRPESIDVGQVLYLYERPDLPKAEAKEKASAPAKKPAESKGKTAEALYEEPERPAEPEEDTSKPRRSLRGVLRRIRR
jgi:LysM repeat protein/predicted Ser/Thr protein kinase